MAQLVKRGLKWCIKLYSYEEEDNEDSIILSDKIILGKLNKK